MKCDKTSVYLALSLIAFPAAVAFKSAPALDDYFGNGIDAYRGAQDAGVDGVLSPYPSTAGARVLSPPVVSMPAGHGKAVEVRAADLASSASASTGALQASPAPSTYFIELTDGETRRALRYREWWELNRDESAAINRWPAP